MTYREIAEWVASNYNLDQYDGVASLIDDVKARFTNDGMYFPPEAASEIKDVWLQESGYEKQLSIEEAMQRRYEQAEQELNDKINNFFEHAQPEYRESEVPYAEESVSEPPYAQPQAPQRPSAIRSLFGRIARFFRGG